MGSLFLLVALFPLIWASVLPPLDPGGGNVCHSGRDLPSLSCCPGWRQQGNDCSIAICDGAASCRPGEVCVQPGVCRCPHGYFGANCVTRCPDQFWGPDCREVCTCHPNGKCGATSGRCVCKPDRWGPRCGRRCRCVHGRCEPRTGQCQCHLGWWGADCAQQCQCHRANSECDPLTGRCNCSAGFWGRRCNIRCYCGDSPCSQRAGECQCQPGWWGTLCDQRCACGQGKCDSSNGLCACHPGYRGSSCSQPCPAGTFGQDCRSRCGHCKAEQPCSTVDGSCLLCEIGWKGDRCDQLCTAGFYGDRCAEECPKCRDGEFCNARTGHCVSCNPGWTGPRCDNACVSGTYGVGCRSSCPECYHGTCHHVTGECLCDVGYSGQSCNSSCQAGTHGMNCSTVCRCLGASCDHVTGNCHLSKVGVVTAAVLLSLLLLLCVLCCCCCGSDRDDPTSRVVDDDSMPIARMKHHVQGVLANLSSAAPCFSLGNQKLPKITVLHHDPDISFNCSFIDSPSAAWDSASFSSFETDEEGPVYCTPPLDDGLYATPAGGFQELSSRCNYLPADPWEPASEDRLQPADIPRTSSIAKAKRPSVSFAEGTKFGPEQRRTSVPDSRPEPSSHPQKKRKLSWRLSRLLPAQQERASEGASPSASPAQGCPQLPPADPQPSTRPTDPSARAKPGDLKRSSTSAKKDAQAPKGGGVGEPQPAGGEEQPAKRWSRMWGGPAAEGVATGTVQAMLKRFGSFQRQRTSPKQERGSRPRGENVLRAHRKLAALDRRDCTPPLGSGEGTGKEPCCPALPGQPGASGSLSKKPLIPTTPVLRKLVANVAEGSGARLGVVSMSTQEGSPSGPDRAEGGQPPRVSGGAPDQD